MNNKLINKKENMFDSRILERSINRLIKTFSDHSNLFLTEADLRCYLIADLLKNSFFQFHKRPKTVLTQYHHIQRQGGMESLPG